jgi:hypothetical protein
MSVRTSEPKLMAFGPCGVVALVPWSVAEALDIVGGQRLTEAQLELLEQVAVNLRVAAKIMREAGGR